MQEAVPGVNENHLKMMSERSECCSTIINNATKGASSGLQTPVGMLENARLRFLEEFYQLSIWGASLILVDFEGVPKSNFVNRKST